MRKSPRQRPRQHRVNRELRRQKNIVLAIIKLDERLKKVEQRNRTVIGFQTDCIGVEAPLLSDDDWPDDDFFWVESKRKVKQ